MRDYFIARYKRTRFWAVYDPEGRLVCVTVYRRGATNLVRRLRQRDRDETGRRNLPSGRTLTTF